MLRLLSLLLFFAASEATVTLVETLSGRIEGFVRESAVGKTNLYLGIPYAKPPIGSLRFQRPETVEKWNITLKATKYSIGCPPHNDLDTPFPYGEDCLTLNVFTPSAPSEDKNGYPVGFFIHPGGYCIGSSSWFNSTVIADSFASRGIIVVTFNYRLGVFGFANTGDDGVIGSNNGLFDQALALQWVHENIRSFGGNPKAITVWGLSAGAASASQLTVSPITRDYIAGSIEMSGSYYASWTTSEQTTKETKRLAKTLGCSTKNSQKIRDCLQKTPAKLINDAFYQMGFNRKSLNLALFSPRLDGEFFPSDYRTLLSESKPVPTLAGVAAEESIFFVIYGGVPSINGFGIPASEWPTFNEKEAERRIREDVFTVGEYGPKAAEIQNRIVDFYLHKNIPPNADSLFYLRRFAAIQSDAQFLIPMILEMREKLESKWPIFLYRNEYLREHHLPAALPIKATVHGVELQTMFNFLLNFKRTDEDLRHREFLIQSIVNFIRTGDPSSSLAKWPKATIQKPTQHLALDVKGKLVEEMEPETLQFWRHLIAEFSDSVLRSVHFQPKVHNHAEF